MAKGSINNLAFDLSPYDGLLYYGEVSAFEKRLCHYGKPAINTSGNWISIPPNSILGDEIASARLAMEHMLEHGRSDLAVLTVAGSPFNQIRLQAFEHVARQSRLSPIAMVLPGRDEKEGWRRVVDDIRTRGGSVGVFATDNHLGMRLCQELTDAGVNVPEEAAVVGIGNETNFCEFSIPPLSAVDTGIDLRGYRAMEELVAQINGKPPLSEPILIPPRGVIVRHSSDLTAVRNPEVRAALRYIHDHADRTIRVDEVVEFVNISRRGLEQKFVKSLNRTIHEEIWRAHLQLAKHLLINTDLFLYQVASQSGFGTLSNFSTLFHRANGLSPGAFRRQHRVRG